MATPLEELKARQAKARKPTRKNRDLTQVSPLKGIQPQQAQTAVTGTSSKLWPRTLRMPNAWKILVKDICKQFPTNADGERWIMSMGLWAYEVKGQRPFFEDEYDRQPEFYYNGEGKQWVRTVRMPREWQQRFREIHMSPDVRCKALGDTETWLFGMGLWAYYEAGQRPSFEQEIKTTPILYGVREF